MIRRPPRSTRKESSAASDVYKRQDIRINDISVSRHHAILKVIGDGVFLDDNDSKFGTLVEIREQLELVIDRPYYIQIGETVMALLVKGPRAERRLTSSEVHYRNVHKEPTKDLFT
eukprot:TRINITY_DN10630_c0_g1_i8.p1 TRINITY_DN10630_c0_g1~~TRINITY_DN10630_c0_g1_i8.p1  ORF type:complete len:123 (-),score=36.19 TRINITY_DN10630_c0_g1_i8:8-355(-)